MNILNRREFLKISALSACTLMISTGLSGCNDDNDTQNIAFDHGVASGDPLSDKVIIWTRATPLKTMESIDVNYEVSTTDDFKNVVHNGVYKTNADQDYTVKIDLQNLSAGTIYYYRFKSGGLSSDIGKTKTLPVGSVSQVKMAIFSCANYPNGYFNAYMEASKIEELDVALHLGDYIYEYGMFEKDGITPAYATKNAEKIDRVLPSDNDTELLSLDDYRKRYALYHTDEGLKALHKACAMIPVWDDHEIANDTYKDGAQNHNEGEGDFATRTKHALQAYFEWLPIRPVTNQKEIYRSFDFGDLLSLHMLETRIIGRNKQLSYGAYYDAVGNFDAPSFTADISAADRTMLGSTQLGWLQSSLASSSATWQVLGQQVLMGRMSIPAELLTLIGMMENPEAYGMTSEELLAKINQSLVELATIKGRMLQGDPSVSAEEKARIETVLPYNLDAWDGYYVERETILGTAKTMDKNLVVLSGDTHNSWGNNLKDMAGDNVGVEFASTSVSSPGMEDYLGLTDIADVMGLEGALALLIDDLQYTNLNDRGFLLVTFTAQSAKAEWLHVSNYDSSTYTMNTARAKTLQTLPGSANRTLV